MTIYSPKQHFAAIALLLLTGCAHRPQLAAPPAACAAKVTADTRIERRAQNEWSRTYLVITAIDDDGIAR